MNTLVALIAWSMVLILVMPIAIALIFFVFLGIWAYLLFVVAPLSGVYNFLKGLEERDYE